MGEEKLRRAQERGGSREVREDPPEIEIMFDFSAHASREDFSRLSKLIKTCDIYIPEICGWDDEILEKKKAIAKGDLQPSTSVDEAFNAQDYEDLCIYDTQIEVEMIDFSRNDYKLVSDKYQSFKDLRNDGFNSFLTGDFKASLIQLKQSLRHCTQFNHLREDMMLTRLYKLIENLPNKYPDLLKKEKVRILIKLGSYHSNLQDRIGSDDVKVKKTTEKNVCDTEVEIMALLREGEDVEDLLIARELIELLIRQQNPLLEMAVLDTNQRYKLIREVSGRFSLKQIEQLSTSLKETSTEKERQQVFRKALTEVGINWPDKAKDFPEFIESLDLDK